MGLPQVSSSFLVEEMATSLGTFVQTAPRIASISNYELNLLAGEEKLGHGMHIHMPNSESSISNKCNDGKSKIQKLKIDSKEQIGRLSVNAEQTMQTTISRTVGFQLRASLAPHANGFGSSGGNGYSPTEVSDSHVKRRLLSPLNVMLLGDHFKGDPEFNQSCLEAGDDNYNDLHKYKKVHIGNYNNIHTTVWSSSCFQELVNSSCNNDSRTNQILTSDGLNCEVQEPNYKSFLAFNDSEKTTKIKSQTSALFIPQNKESSPRFPLSPLGKKPCTDKFFGECRDIDTELSDANLILNDVEQSLNRNCQAILSAQEIPRKSQFNSNSMQQNSVMVTPDNIIDTNEYWTFPASFPPRRAKLCGSVNRLPIRRTLVGSFEESLLSGRLLSDKVSQVGHNLIYEPLLVDIIRVMFLLSNSCYCFYYLQYCRKLKAFLLCSM